MIESKDDFLDSTYEYIANFFETSLQELQDRNPGLESRFKRIDQTHFTAAAYIAGAKRTACRIWLAGRGSFPGGIGYSASDTSSDNSFNESLSVADDGYKLLLKPLGLAFVGGSSDDLLTQQGGAEYLWSVFVRPLQ